MPRGDDDVYDETLEERIDGVSVSDHPFFSKYADCPYAWFSFYKFVTVCTVSLARPVNRSRN